MLSPPLPIEIQMTEHVPPSLPPSLHPSLHPSFHYLNMAAIA